MPTTIKDIARIAGVSHSTVSRALRDHPAIAPQTVARVKQIADEVGYIPSAAARGLRTRRSQALGVIVSSIDDPFFSEVLQGIEDVLQCTGYSLLVAASHRNPECERAITRTMGERRVDGVIVCSTPFSEDHGRLLQDYGLPVAVINNQAAEEYRYSIYHDDHYGSQRVTRHLIDLGHREIAYLGNADAGRTTHDRLQGFLSAMRSAGLPVRDEFIYQGPNGRPVGGAAGAHYFLGLRSRPTAIVCFNDMMAIGVIQGLHQAGLHIPESCSIAGFDNIHISSYTCPPLTTFNQPKYLLGREAAQMMLRLLNPVAGEPEESSDQIIRLRGELIVRASTAPVQRQAKGSEI